MIEAWALNSWVDDAWVDDAWAGDVVVITDITDIIAANKTVRTSVTGTINRSLVAAKTDRAVVVK